MFRYMFPWIQTVVDKILRSQGETAFYTISVKDVWFGYHDVLMELVNDGCQALNVSCPVVHDGRFGFYTDVSHGGGAGAGVRFGPAWVIGSDWP